MRTDPNDNLTIRRLTAEDAERLAHVSERDSAPAPRGSVLGAEVAGRLVAAIGLDDGHLVADPFYPSGHAAELLRARADQLVGATHPRRRRGTPIARLFKRAALPGRATGP